VLIDGTFGALDDDVLELVIDVFTNELKSAGVIHVGGAGEAHDLFSKTLHLVKAPRSPVQPDAPAEDADRPIVRKESGNPP
jgi:ABC-type uncharacterized transport system fused permease/ATPase subunit